MGANSKRIILGIGVIAIAVALFVILSPGGSGESGPGESNEATASLESESGHEAVESASTESQPTDEPESENPGPAGPEVPTVVVRDGQPVGGVLTVEVKRGETARFDVRSDVEEEVHVHGYDIYAEVAPGQPAQVRFTAEFDGVYEVELERAHVPIVDLVVNP